MAEEIIFGFDSSTAERLKRMAGSAESSIQSGSPKDVPAGATAVFGRVSTAAASGSTSTPTVGEFKVRDIGLAGETTSLSTQTYKFVNPHEGVEFLVDEDIVLVDTGQSWIPVVPSANQANGVGHGTLPSAIDTTDATVTVNLAATSPLDPSTTITATNWAEIAADAGAKAVVQKTGTTWTLIQISC